MSLRVNKMKKRYKLDLNVWLEWKCKNCGKRKSMQDNEEWQLCCAKTMTMQPMKKFVIMEK